VAIVLPNGTTVAGVALAANYVASTTDRLVGDRRTADGQQAQNRQNDRSRRKATRKKRDKPRHGNLQQKKETTCRQVSLPF